MHPSDLKSLKIMLGVIRTELAFIHEAIKDHSASVIIQKIEQQKSNQEEWEKTQEVLARPRRTDPDEQAASETNQERRHRQNFRLQGLLALGTWLAFVAAAIYAAIAAYQLHQMRLATEASARAAYVACKTLVETQKSEIDAHLAAVAAYAQARVTMESQKSEVRISLDMPSPRLWNQPFQLKFSMRNDGRSDATNISILGRALVVPNGACSKFDYPRQSSFILDAPVLRAGEVFPNQQTGSEFKPIEVDVIVTDDKGNKLMYTPELDRDIFMLHRKEVVTYATISYGDFVADYTRTEADAMWFLQKGESIDPALAEANNRCMAGYNKQTEKLKILPPSPPDITGRSADESIDSKFGENPCPVPKEDP